MPNGLARFWDVISGAARRRASRAWRAEWCRVRFDDGSIEIVVRERPAWRNRVRWDDDGSVVSRDILANLSPPAPAERPDVG